MEPLPLGLVDYTIDASLCSLWSYQDQEDINKLRQDLLAATLELENTKEEVKKKEENIHRLVELVRQTSKERDEARAQLKQLVARLHPESPQTKPTHVASSVTDSDSLSDTRNHYVSSPADPFFDTVTSSDPSNMNMHDSCTMASAPKQQHVMAEHNVITPTREHRANQVIDLLAKNKPLPQKGKLLQAVMEAGPLLQNLLVAGPLPRWRNPPPLQQLDVLPLAMKGPPVSMLRQGGSAMNSTSQFAQAMPNVAFSETVTPISSASQMLGFTNSQGFCKKRPVLTLPAAASCFQSLNAKRQKSH